MYKANWLNGFFQYGEIIYVGKNSLFNSKDWQSVILMPHLKFLEVPKFDKPKKALKMLSWLLKSFQEYILITVYFSVSKVFNIAS